MILDAEMEGLWLEFKKAIDYGNFKKFKTRRGFDSYIRRLIEKTQPGKSITFTFMREPGKYERFILYKARRTGK